MNNYDKNTLGFNPIEENFINSEKYTENNNSFKKVDFDKLDSSNNSFRKRNTINVTSTNKFSSLNKVLENEELQINDKNNSIINKVSNCIHDFLNGLWDSLQIFNIFSIIKSSNKIGLNLRNCILLNGFIMISSNIFFLYFLERIINYYINSFSSLSYFFSIGKYLYVVFWIIPIFLICNILTAFWIDEIYFESLECIEKTKSINVEGLDAMTAIANQIQRQLIVLSFIFAINILNIFLNFFSNFSNILANVFFIIKFIAMSILNSLYVFEYILMQKYLKNFKSILYFIENKILYFFGYGILLTILINFIDSITISSAIFLILFPFFLIASVKVNNKRFSNQKVIKMGKLKFFYIIDLIYDNLLKIIFRIFKLRK